MSNGLNDRFRPLCRITGLELSPPKISHSITLPESTRDTYDTRTNKDTVHSHLHHQSRIRRSSDTTRGEQDDGESLESCGFLEEVEGRLQVLGEGVEFLSHSRDKCREHENMNTWSKCIPLRSWSMLVGYQR